MRAFWVLLRLRVLELWRKPSSVFWFYVLPLLLLAMVWALFADGHPFERRRVLWVAGEAAARAQLAADPGVRVEDAGDHAIALRRLGSREVSAVVTDGVVEVGEREALFGRGLAQTIAARLSIVALPRAGYLQFLLPGLLAQAIFVAGLFGLGYALARYRQSRLLDKLRTTPLRPATFVFALAAGRLLLVLGQLALVLLAGAWAFALPLDATAIGLALVTGALGLGVFLGLGFWLATVIESEDLLGDVIAALGIPVALLSGIFFAVDALPAPLGTIVTHLPPTLLVTALRQVIVHGDPRIAAPLTALLGWAIAFWGIAIWRWRWR